MTAPTHPPRSSGIDNFRTTLRNIPSLIVIGACVWVLIFWLGAAG